MALVGSLDASLTDTMTASPSADIVKRAKGLAKAEALFALDSGSKGLASAMTESFLESGTVVNGTSIAAAYDAITEKDISSALATMTKSNPSVAAVGDIGAVPYQGTFASRF